MKAKVHRHYSGEPCQACIQAGRREVVEWLMNNGCGFEDCDMEYQVLQAKLEEWGLSK